VVAGSMEFRFRERRKFSDDDVMDLGLIAAVVSESLGSVPIGDGKRWEGCEFVSATIPAQKIERSPEPSANQRVNPGDYRSNRVRVKKIPSNTASLESATHGSDPIPSLAPSKLAAAASPFWRALRRAWTGHPR
jgi:hypothetical protein